MVKLVIHNRPNLPGGKKLMLKPGPGPLPGICPSVNGCPDGELYPNDMWIHLPEAFFVLDGAGSSLYLSCIILPENVIKLEKAVPNFQDPHNHFCVSSIDRCSWCFDTADAPPGCNGSASTGDGLRQDAIVCFSNTWVFSFVEMEFPSDTPRWVVSYGKQVQRVDDTPVGPYDLCGIEPIDQLIDTISAPDHIDVTTSP